MYQSSDIVTAYKLQIMRRCYSEMDDPRDDELVAAMEALRMTVSNFFYIFHGALFRMDTVHLMF